MPDNEFLFVGGDRVGHGFYRKHGLRGRVGHGFHRKDRLRGREKYVFYRKDRIRDREKHGFYRKQGLRDREEGDFYSRNGWRDSKMEVFYGKDGGAGRGKSNADETDWTDERGFLGREKRRETLNLFSKGFHVTSSEFPFVAEWF